MTQSFIKNGQIQTFDVRGGKVVATIKIDGRWVSNPSYEDFIADGWQPYTPPAPEPYLPTKEELVESKLRERYSINQEFEVNRKRDTEPQAFAAYYAYVEECIAWAEQQPHRVITEEATRE